MKKTYSLIILLVSFQCFSQNINGLDKLMDDWHTAASNANYDAYFNFMSNDFVFMGTAPGERWGKDQFSEFSKPHFDKGSAWDFKASNRNWQFSGNGKIAWFDEELATWMRDCRGTGVLVKKKGQWQIVQYSLSVLIENEKMTEFLKLRDLDLK